MSDHQFLDQIINLIETKVGLNSNATCMPIWDEMIKERMGICHLVTYKEYFDKLNHSSDEFQELIEKIVIPESWFFREKGVFDFLFHWVTQSDYQIPYLKILSLACSTGEEPYSIAMTLMDAGLSKNGFSINALDISKTALFKAHLGIFGNNAFRTNDLNFRDYYFHKTSLGYAINEKIKEKVQFYHGNLIDPYSSYNSHTYHLILCRNVLMYFNKEAQKKALQNIIEALTPSGILIVGSAEKQIAHSMGFVSTGYPKSQALKLKNESIKKEF